MTRAAEIGLDLTPIYVRLDIEKQIFQVYEVDKAGHAVLRRKLERNGEARFFSEQPHICGIETSGSAYCWSRVLSGLGHTVRLMAPQFVKPCVSSQKNDAKDAEAICKAATRPNTRFVPQESVVVQQDLQCLHRVRSRPLANQTQLVNQILRSLAEYLIVLPQDLGRVRSSLPAVSEDAENQLTAFGRALFQGFYSELVELDKKISHAGGRIQIAFRNTPDCQRIAAVQRVGPPIATAVVAAISDGQLHALAGLNAEQHLGYELARRLRRATAQFHAELRQLSFRTGADFVGYCASRHLWQIDCLGGKSLLPGIALFLFSYRYNLFKQGALGNPAINICGKSWELRPRCLPFSNIECFQQIR